MKISVDDVIKIFQSIKESETEIKALKKALEKSKTDQRWFEKKLRNCICPDCGFGFDGV